MKNLIAILLVIISLNTSAQTDSTTAPITVTLPVKAIVIYAAYLSEVPTWEDRKAPDLLLTKIGSGNLPDSLTTVTLRAKNLADYVIRLSSERSTPQ